MNQIVKAKIREIKYGKYLTFLGDAVVIGTGVVVAFGFFYFVCMAIFVLQ